MLFKELDQEEIYEAKLDGKILYAAKKDYQKVTRERYRNYQ